MLISILQWRASSTCEAVFPCRDSHPTLASRTNCGWVNPIVDNAFSMRRRHCVLICQSKKPGLCSGPVNLLIFFQSTVLSIRLCFLQHRLHFLRKIFLHCTANEKCKQEGKWSSHFNLMRDLCFSLKLC